MRCLGLDIGGANLKAADGFGWVRHQPFALWRRPDDLEGELRALVHDQPAPRVVAVTMTGELCDCFASKAEGVRHILACAGLAFPDSRLFVWTVVGEFRTVEMIARSPLDAAASNWLALAVFAGRFAPKGRAMLLDLGSTTADLVPLRDGAPQPTALTDSNRLACGELVYCGVRRTPLCALFGLEKATEFFATTEDVYLVLGDLAEEPERCDTADGRPATRLAAHARLARMDCGENWPEERVIALAKHARDLQIRGLARQLQRVADYLDGPLDSVVLAGAGEFLWPDVLRHARFGDVPRVSLRDKLGPDLTAAACAHAVARLFLDGASRMRSFP